MKIKLYLEHYRSRHGDSGCLFHYNAKERARSILNTFQNRLEEDEVGEIEALIAADKPQEAIDLLFEYDDGCSGHEIDFDDVVIDVSKAEVVQ